MDILMQGGMKHLRNICNNIKRQNQKLSSSIAERHRAKYLRDNIKVYHHQRHNRRFRRSYRKRHNRERVTSSGK